MFDKFSSHHIGHGPDENAWKMNQVIVQALKNGENESVDSDSECHHIKCGPEYPRTNNTFISRSKLHCIYFDIQGELLVLIRGE
jgi:hypothetical protein